MKFKGATHQEIRDAIKGEPLAVICVPNSNAADFSRFVQNFSDYGQKFQNYKFIFLDEQSRAHLDLPFNAKAPVTYYIFRQGYMLFRRDYEIGVEDLELTLQFAVAIDMPSWLKEEPRFQLSL